MSVYKKVAITFSIIISLLFGAGWYISSVYEDEVKNFILSEINNRLNTKVDMEEINFSVFKKFPYASLELKNVRADEVISKEKKDDLFKIKSIFLQFNIIDIIKENYTIKKIAVEDGFINLSIDKKGNDNFHFWKKDTAQTANAFQIELSKLDFENISISMVNDFKKLDFFVLVDQLNLSGNFSDKDYTLNTDAKLLLQELNSNNQKWIKNKKIKLSTALAVNQETGKYTIENGKVAIEDLSFNLSGNFIDKKNYTVLDIVSKGNNLSIESIFSLFPPEQQEKLKSYKTTGDITYNANIKGNYSFTESPNFEASFSILNGEIVEQNSELSLTQLSVNGRFINVKSNPTKLELKNFNANFGAGHIAGDYTITDLNNPHVVLKSVANIDILSAKSFFKIDTLELAEGKLELNIEYNGYISELSNIKAQDLQKLAATGNVKLSETNFKLVNYPHLLSNLNASFQFNNNEIIIDSLQTNFNKSAISLNGSFKNLLAYLFIEDQKLLVNANFHAKKIILDDLLTSNNNTKNNNDYSLILPQNISFQLNTKIDSFYFRKFEAKNFSSQLKLHNKQFTASNIQFNAMQGSAKGELYIDESDSTKTIITSTANLENININQLFYQFENFGQNYFVAENIKGNVSSAIQFASVWDKNLKLNKDKLYVLADLTIKKGELINYKPALALSKFIEINELEHIKFSTLQTQLEIKNQIISIPKTEIKSSALDLTISGTHTFDNEIDYRFKLLMSDVLWKKAKSKKKENSEFGYEEEDGLGKAVLFLRMTGTVKNPKISYDTKSLKEKWSDDIKEEKRTLKQILKDEFGWFKKDSTLTDPKKPKKDGFLIEWEEDTRKSEVGSSKTEDRSGKPEEKKGLGKLIDKIAKPDAEEYEESDDF